MAALWIISKLLIGFLIYFIIGVVITTLTYLDTSSCEDEYAIGFILSVIWPFYLLCIPFVFCYGKLVEFIIKRKENK